MTRLLAATVACAAALTLCPAALASSGGAPAKPPLGDGSTGGTRDVFGQPDGPPAAAEAPAPAEPGPPAPPPAEGAQVQPQVPLVEDPGTGGDDGGEDDGGGGGGESGGEEPAPSAPGGGGTSAAPAGTGLPSTGFEALLLCYAGLALLLLGGATRATVARPR